MDILSLTSKQPVSVEILGRPVGSKGTEPKPPTSGVDPTDKAPPGSTTNGATSQKEAPRIGQKAPENLLDLLKRLTNGTTTDSLGLTLGDSKLAASLKQVTLPPKAEDLVQALAALGVPMPASTTVGPTATPGAPDTWMKAIEQATNLPQAVKGVLTALLQQAMAQPLPASTLIDLGRPEPAPAPSTSPLPYITGILSSNAGTSGQAEAVADTAGTGFISNLIKQVESGQTLDPTMVEALNLTAIVGNNKPLPNNGVDQTLGRPQPVVDGIDTTQTSPPSTGSLDGVGVHAPSQIELLLPGNGEVPLPNNSGLHAPPIDGTAPPTLSNLGQPVNTTLVPEAGNMMDLGAPIHTGNVPLPNNLEIPVMSDPGQAVSQAAVTPTSGLTGTNQVPLPNNGAPAKSSTSRVVGPDATVVPKNGLAGTNRVPTANNLGGTDKPVHGAATGTPVTAVTDATLESAVTAAPPVANNGKFRDIEPKPLEIDDSNDVKPLPNNSAPPIPVGRPDGIATVKPASSNETLPDPVVKSVSNQIADRIETMVLGKKSGSVTVRLNPLDLGTITMTVRSFGTKVDTSIQASHDEVRAALHTHRQDLIHNVESRGLSLNSFHVGQEAGNSARHHGQQSLQTEANRNSNMRLATGTSSVAASTPQPSNRLSNEGVDFLV